MRPLATFSFFFFFTTFLSLVPPTSPSLHPSRPFLDASSHLYKRPCPSVGPPVILQLILNDLDSAGRGKKRDEEEGGTRRKEGREEQGTSKVKK